MNIISEHNTDREWKYQESDIFTLIARSSLVLSDRDKTDCYMSCNCENLTLLIISWTSDSVGFCPARRMAA